MTKLRSLLYGALLCALACSAAAAVQPNDVPGNYHL